MAYFETIKLTGSLGAVLDAAAGTAAPPNALQIAGSDGTNLRVLATDTGGQLKVLVENTVAVTGTFYQATQPVSSTQLPAALDGSGFLKVHEQGTANVSIQNASIAVTGTFYQATQPISAASLPLPANAAQETGGNLATLAGTVSAGKVGVTVSNFPATQPVSGTVALSAGSAIIGKVGIDQTTP